MTKQTFEQLASEAERLWLPHAGLSAGEWPGMVKALIEAGRVEIAVANDEVQRLRERNREQLPQKMAHKRKRNP